MNTEKLANNQWMDLVPPAAPDDASLLYVAIGSALTALVLLALWWFWRKQPHRRAIQQIHRLQNTSTTHAVKSMTFDLAAQLRLGFQVARLDLLQFAPEQQPAWQAYLQALQQACYHPATPEPQQLTQLCQAGLYWLKLSKARHDA